MKTLSKEEFIVGGIFGLCFLPAIGLWAIPLAIITSILWVLGGTYSKWFRRLGVPLVTGLFVFNNNLVSLGISVLVVFGILSIGYGIPSTQPLDEGSALGKFWYKVSPKLAEYLTRGTIYLLLLATYSLILMYDR